MKEYDFVKKGAIFCNKLNCLLLVLGFFTCLNLQAQVTTGSTITFEAGAPRQLTGASTNPSVANIDGHNLGVSAVTAGDIVNITINNTFTGISGGTDLAVIMTATGTNVTSFSFKSDNAANNFGVTSFAFAVATGTTQNITVQGYDGGSPVSGAITKTIVSPGETNFTISSGDISGSSGWSNIDEIRMTMNTPAPANFAIDDVLLTAAAASNTAPTIGGASAGQNVNDNATISPFSGITITDADGDNVTATITLDNNAKGVITGADGGAGPYTMTSKTAAAMQTALRALVFNPTDNRTSTSETTTFTVVVNDGTVDATNNTTTVVSSAVAPVISQVTPVATPTNDNTPNYTFTTNETGTFSLGGSCGTSTSTTISGTGNQTITLTQTNNSSALADGTYSNCTVTVTDAGGKASSPLSITSFTVDTQAPTTPGTPDLIGGFDSGTSSTDNITSVTQPRFAGTGIEVGVTIKISSSINGLVGTTTTNVGGSYSYIITGTLSEGTHNITVTATDAAGNESSSSSALSVVVDTSAPTLSSSSPADDATGVNTSGNITLTFNENIAFGTGNIEVIDETNGSNSFTIDAASPGTQASISGAVLTINPSSNLDLSSNYSVRIAATAIDDIAGNSYAGITNGTVLNFGTNNAPTVTVNTGLTLNEGATELIDSGKLNASDTEGGTLTFTITTATTKGTLFIDTNPSNTFNAGDTELVLNATFTKNDLDSDRIRYVSTTDNDISDSFVFKVADPDGGELTNQTFNITITPVNDAPTATGIPTDIVVIEDIASNFDLSSVTFADPEDNQLTVTIVVSAGSFGSPVDGAAVGAGVVETLVNATTITLVGSPADINTYLDTPANIKYTGASNVNGADAATYTINANDGTVNPQVGSGNIDITAVNDEPSFTIGVNTTVAQNAGAQTVNGFISVFDDGDPEVAQTLSFNVANNNNGLFTVQPAISATGVLTFTPDATKFGKAVVTVSIQDNGANGGNDDNISANQTFNIYVTPISIKINEAHPSAVSTSEFVEIYDGGAGNTDITGLVVVMFNGGDDLAYKDVSPTGSTDGTGFYVIGDAGVTNLDLSWGAFDLQNGPDAIALYVGAESDFTSASPPTTDGLVDVLFYGSSDDATLRAALGNSALIAAGDGSNSLSRSPDGTGGFLVQASTPGAINDVTAPTVTSVSGPANATYIANQNLDFTVNFSENVTVVTTGGTPQLAVTIGSTTRQATYQSGSGTSALLFRYVVQSGELDTDGIVLGNLVTNGGTLQDAAGNNATLTLNSVGVTTSILVDSSAPTVTSVSVPANATYIANQNLDFTVNFSENVTVVTTGGTPQLAITIGSTTRQATYQSGSGTQALLFRYTVVSGELDTDGIVVGNLIANGGTLKDAAGNNATLTLNSVGATTSVLVDSSAPTITSLGLANSNAFIEIFLNEGVFNTNGGSGALEISDIAISISGGTATNPVITSLKKVDGTTDLTGGENIIRVTFTTTGVADGSEVVKIDFADGSSVFDAAGNAASATQSNNTRTLNDLIKPNITGVSLAADNSYIDVTFNEGVYEDNCTGGGLQASDFNLSISNGTATTPVISSVKKNDNTAEGSATALTGGETVVRIFFSVTGTPDGAETLEVDLQANAVFDANGLAAEANQNTNNTAALNDKVVPTVLEVTSNATNGTFKVGDNINIYVQYSEEVLVTGTPQLELETGTTDRTINYVDRSVSTLRFVYTVQAGDVSADLDVTSSTALSLNGGTIKDAAGNNASLTVQQGATGGSLASNKAIVIDGVVPTITSVSVPADGIYKTGSTFTFTVTVSESVVVTNTPQLPLDIGGVTRQATYQPGLSTTTLLRFQYTVQSGDLDPTDGISLGASLDLNTTGTIKDGAGNNLVLTLPIVPSTAAVLVDGVVPTVTNVTSSTADGTYKIGDQVNVQVVFSEVIYVNTINQIQLQLETGTLDYYIAAVSGSGTNTLNFTYTVQAGTESADLDYKATNSLDISLSGTARDAAGNDAVLTLPAPGAANSLGANKAIVIDGVAPVITSVSSVKVDGSYGLGESIAITVTFDEAVTVTGTPQLELETGAVDRKVDYSSGTGTNTLTFAYTVQMGDESTDLDYKATNALTLNGGTIKDAAGNNATLTLAAPGAANSLGNNKALVIEAFPTVTLSVGSTSIAEAAGTSSITATLSAISSQDVTVTLAYSGTATNGIDYNVTASTSITVPAGSLSANATVGIIATQDANPETNETIIIDITGVTKGTENGTQQQTITITDDDTPNVSFTSTTSSGLESVSSANITVDLNIASALTVTVNYAVTGTATSGTDYTLANGTLTFNPADVQETISIASIVDDAIFESNETVIITLSNPSNANLGTNTVHTYTITDNDAAAVTIADVSGAENGGAITLTATLDNAVQGGFTVDVSTTDGTATTADGDYTAIAGQTLTFAGTAGETQTFTITPTADTKLETNETVTISQGNLAATSLSVNITDGATVTINNDDNAAVTIADVSGSENGGAITLTATLDNAVQGGFTVDVNTTDGTALAASDYTAIAGQTLTFTGTAGETQTFTVTPTNDAVEESTESLTVSMNNLAGTTLGVAITDNATITLTDDDDNTAPTGFTITISDALIAASETATTKFTFAGAEVGATYNYTVSSNNGGTNVTGTGTIATATDQITINNLSGLNDGTLTLSVTLTDGSSNTSTAQTATTVLKSVITTPVLTPSDNAIDILPSANLTMAFGEDIFKGTGNITIKKKSDGSTIETIDVTSSAVTISSGTVTIDPVNLILPPATEFYVNIDAGALTDIAGNSYAINNNTDWSFTIIASSVVTSVAVPANATYKIGDQLDFTASFTLPITITGTPSIPVTIGASTKTASLKAAVNNSNTAIFSYTIAEGDLDTDGIALGTAISLNGGTIKDQFGTDAQLALNNIAATTSINVDGVRPVPTLTTSAATLVNGSFTVEFTYSEAVTNFTLADITVANGTATNFTTITAGTKWSAQITPTADGTVSTSLAAGVANDNAGNASAAGTAVSKTYDGTAPTALSLTRKTANPILTASAGFRATFSEDVTGVDLTDFEVILTGTATGTLNAVAQVDAKTYDITITGISGQGSIGLNLKDDDSILDAANNPLSGALTGEVYVTNIAPTDITLSPTTIDENNALSAEVGTLSTTDTDATDTHTYSLIAGTGDTDNTKFMVAGNKLFAGATFDHEAKDSYSIRLQTQDNNGGRFEKALTITINDVNEAPTDISLSNNTIDEADDAGILVGTMASVDQDAAETFTYTLVAGTGDDNNLLFTFTGDELRTAAPINFESNTMLSIRVKVTDSGGLSYEETFNITINNVELEEIRDFTKDAPDARIKNFFSPNGDGINDFWVIDDILDNPINEVKVFSQNGTLIFSQRNYKNTWDGTYKGEAIPPGTYYYEINVYNGEQIVKGFLTIIRTTN